MSAQTSPGRVDAIVVIAEFTVPAAKNDEFLAVCEADGRGSVAHEPGCQQFDTLTCSEQPELVVLFEVYDDEAAFQTHLQTPHYATFADGVKRLGLAEPTVRFMSRARRGGA